MKATRVLVLLMLVGMLCVATPQTAGPSDPGFDKLKTLVGDWEGKTADGLAMTTTYKLVSGGTALMERMGVGDMINMYHPDGSSLMLTHYCEGNNQPRMRASGLSRDGKTLDFKFLDVTNQASATDDVMRSVKLTFQDADHISQEWISGKEGKETSMVVSFTRKK